MANLIDSKTKRLTADEIVRISAENGEGEPPAAQTIEQLKAISASKGATVLRYGNTLFFIYKPTNRSSYFQMFNADVARNFIENCIQAIKACYEMGIDYVVAEFTNPIYINATKIVSKRLMGNNAGHQILRTKRNTYLVVMQCGPRRERA